MTLIDIENKNSEFLSIAEVAEYLHVKPQGIRETLRRGVSWGYVIGDASFIIPRLAFISCHKNGATYMTQTPKTAS